MTDPSVLVMGYGSIGARHARLLVDAGCNVAVVSKREVNFPKQFRTLEEGWLVHQPSLVIVANPTAAHYAVLVELVQLGHSESVLVEKPLFDKSIALPKNKFKQLRVAYNLRFHPVLVRLRELLQGQRVVSVQAYVGQYLPDWRPGTNYRHCYSAHGEQGGGALLDLSHDLDYLSWMVGPWRRVAAIGGKFSMLEITSDDMFSLLYESDLCPAICVQLNYLDRVGRRQVIVNTQLHTYEVDLIRNTLRFDEDVQQFPVERDTTYRALHSAVLSGSPGQACTVQEALNTLALCDAARDAVEGACWSKR